jgi:hypothetical protein
MTALLSTLSLVVLLTLTAAGCGRPPSQLHNNNQTDAAGLEDGGVDAGPLRRLVERRLFGGSPVDNRFFDPNFVNIDTTAWSPLNQYTWETSVATWIFVRTPLGQPALKLLAGQGQNRGEILGLVKSTPGPIEVSIWLGRPSGVAHEDTLVSLLALFVNGDARADLEMEDLQTAVTLDGIEWVRWSVMIEDGPVGWANLRVHNNSQEPLYLTSPQLIRAPALRLWGMFRPYSRLRPLTSEERAVVKAYWRSYQDRF